MTDIENELIKHYYATADILRLQHNLENAKKRLEDAYTPPNMAVNPQLARIQKSEVSSQVERIAEYIEQELKTDIDYIKQQLSTKRAVIILIDQWIQAANLKPLEETYVRLRYKENNKPEKICETMGYEKRQAERYRASALDKLRATYRAYSGGGKANTPWVAENGA